jgi:hypothetical protein
MASLGFRPLFGRLLPSCLSFALWLGAGCGTQGDATVQPDTWPRAGLSGYVFIDPDDPELLSRPGFDLDEPAAAPDGQGLVIYGRMAPPGAPLVSEIFAARVASLDAPDEVQGVLGPTLPWEGQGLRGPSIAAAELPLLFYQGEDGSVGVAERDTLKKGRLEAPLASAAQLGGGRRVGRVASVLDPGPAPGGAEDRFRLYYTVDDSEIYVAVADAQSVLAAAHSSATVDWRVHPVGLAAASFLVPPGDVKPVAAERIVELSARRVVTPAGRARWDLFVVASGSGKDHLVAASAYAEGGGLERFVPASTPLIKTSDGVLLSPSVTTFSREPLLLVGLRQVQTIIAAAVLP